jgi:hypothetical protein
MVTAAELIKRWVDDPGIKLSNWIYQSIFKPKLVFEDEPEPVRLSEKLADVEVRDSAP